MKHPLVPLLVVVCCLSACASTKYEDVYGMHVSWGTQQDRRFEEVVSECEERLGLSFDPGATIRFLGPRPKDVPVAGLFYPTTEGTIHLYDAACLDATSLCHELLHRYIWMHSGSKHECYATRFPSMSAEKSCLQWGLEGDPDYNHKRPEWKFLPGASTCPVRHFYKPPPRKRRPLVEAFAKENPA